MKKLFLLIMLSLMTLPMTSFSTGNWDDSQGWPWNRTASAQDAPENQVPGFFINLGLTGARVKLIGNTEANHVVVKYVWTGSPADGKLQSGDRITGVNGTPFATKHKNGYGPTQFGYDGQLMDIGNALELAQDTTGSIIFNITRQGNPLNKTVTIGTTYGKYSDTFPYNCSKTDKILPELYAFIAAQQDPSTLWTGIDTKFLGGMALLASNDDQYLDEAYNVVQWFGANTHPTVLATDLNLDCWKNCFAGIFMSEYYLRVKDKAGYSTQATYAKAQLTEVRDWILEARYIGGNPNGSPDINDQYQIGGWGHHPHTHINGYGAFNYMTSQAVVALNLIKRCGITVNSNITETGLAVVAQGTNNIGYSWYGWESYDNDYADMGRTGTAAMANYTLANNNQSYIDQAKLHAQCIGYNDRFKSFPDTHGSPFLGMVWTSFAARLDPQGYENLMQYHKAWFSLAQTHDGNQFVPQPNRDVGGSYRRDPRVLMSAVIALVLGSRENNLHLTGKAGGNGEPSGSGGGGNPGDPIDFSLYATNGELPHHASRTGTQTINGTTITFVGKMNGDVITPFTVTANTVLEFDFSSTELQKRHWIGFKQGSTQHNFWFAGTSGARSMDYALPAYSDSGTQSYVVDLSNFMPLGSYDSLFVKQLGGSASANGTWSNVKVYEDTQ